METTTIPVVITPEAEVYLDQHGVRAAFDQMIEYVRQNVPGVYQIEVNVEPPYDTGGDDVVLITVLRHEPVPEDDQHRWNMIRWEVTTFPPEVLLRISVLLL